MMLLRKGNKDLNLTSPSTIIFFFFSKKKIEGVFVKLLGRCLPCHLFAVVPELCTHSVHWDLCKNTLEVAPAGLKSCRCKKTEDDQRGSELDLAVIKSFLPFTSTKR